MLVLLTSQLYCSKNMIKTGQNSMFHKNYYPNESLMLILSCFYAEEDDQEVMYADVRIRQQQEKQVKGREEEVEYGQVKLSQWPYQTEPTWWLYRKIVCVAKSLKSGDLDGLCIYTDCTTKCPQREEVMLNP